MTDKPCWGITDAPNVDMTQYSSAQQLADELGHDLPQIFVAAAFMGLDFTEACNPDFQTQMQASVAYNRANPEKPARGASPIIMVMDGASVPRFIAAVKAMTNADWTDCL